jgi:hypothetical protein
MPARDRIEDVADKGGAGEVRGLGIGEPAGVVHDPLLECGNGLRRGVHPGGVILKHKLGTAKGCFKFLYQKPEIMGDTVRVHKPLNIGQVPGKRAEQQSGLFRVFKVFSVDPQQIDGARGFAGCFFMEQLVDKHPGIHGYPFHFNVKPLFHLCCHPGIHPGVDMGPSPVHVPLDPGAPGLFPDLFERDFQQGVAGCPGRQGKWMKKRQQQDHQQRDAVQSQGHKISFQVKGVPGPFFFNRVW